MKKLIILISAIFIANFINAQHVTFGIKGGLNLANLTGVNDNTTRVSFNAGGLAHIHINEHFAVQPEVFYSGQGIHFQNGNNPDADIKLGYINIPVLLQYMTGDGFRLETGPQVGILASAKAKSGSTSVDIKNSYKTADFSWAFGLSYLTKSRVGISARYNLGISDISDSNNSDVKNSVFNIGLFYHFKGK